MTLCVNVTLLRCHYSPGRHSNHTVLSFVVFFRASLIWSTFIQILAPPNHSDQVWGIFAMIYLSHIICPSRLCSNTTSPPLVVRGWSNHAIVEMYGARLDRPITAINASWSLPQQVFTMGMAGGWKYAYIWPEMGISRVDDGHTPWCDDYL